MVFLPGLFLLYHLTRGRIGWPALLVASYGFYAGAGASYLLAVLAGVTVVTYCCGLWLIATPDGTRKRVIFACGIAANVLTLIGMKYLKFLWESLAALSPLVPAVRQLPEPPLLVSVGISFFVFQAVGYLVDLYLELEEPERHFGYFALSLAFFPKLLQGPIEQCGPLAQQFREPYRFDYQAVRFGLLLFLWGAFKKMVIADRLALFVDAAYANPQGYPGTTLAYATILYAFQLYLDFSGYTDMALGAARLFNIRLSPNFDSPYLATSVGDFWRRWHMTFSRWILGNIFKPLQMRWRNWGNTGTMSALLVTFLVSGIWHGAAWGFVVWGLIHGVYMSCSILWKPYQKNIYRRFRVEKSPALKVWQRGVTFLLICFAWIFFRADSLGNGWYIATHLFSPPDIASRSWGEFVANNFLVGQSIWDFYLVVGLLIAMGAIAYLCRKRGSSNFPDVVEGISVWQRWATYYLLTLGIIFGGMFDNGTFIYFQF